MKTMWRLWLLLVAKAGAALQDMINLHSESQSFDLEGDLGRWRPYLSALNCTSGETEAQMEEGPCSEGYREANGRGRPMIQGLPSLPSKCVCIASQDP